MKACRLLHASSVGTREGEERLWNEALACSASTLGRRPLKL